MVPGELHLGKLHQDLLDLRGHFEKLVLELQKALFKSQKQKKDLEKQLEESENKREELNKLVLDYEGHIKDLKHDLEQREAQTKDPKNSVDQSEDDIKKELDQVGFYESRIEIMTKERDGLINKLKSVGAELKEAQEDLELGKKVWEVERIALAERLTNAKEMWEAEKIALTNEILTKECQDSTCKYNQALKERDAALSDLNNLGVELEEVRKDLSESQANLELGKKVWEAERIAVAERLTNAKEVWEAERMELTKKLNHELNKFGIEIKELREELSDLEKIHKQHIQENENAYCSGYLTGWFKEPHAYISLPSHEAKEVTLLDHEPLEATSPLSHTCALIKLFGSADP
ncbi:myosin heavy chain, fast skeletal muscle [Rosa sericea]